MHLFPLRLSISFNGTIYMETRRVYEIEGISRMVAPVAADSLYKNALAMSILRIGELYGILSDELRGLTCMRVSAVSEGVKIW